MQFRWVQGDEYKDHSDGLYTTCCFQIYMKYFGEMHGSILGTGILYAGGKDGTDGF